MPSSATRAIRIRHPYDPKAESELVGTINEIREVSTGALKGLYLAVKTRSAVVDVYLGPTDFINFIEAQFSNEFKKGDTVKALGVKVRFENKNIVLARQVRKRWNHANYAKCRWYASVAVDD